VRPACCPNNGAGGNRASDRSSNPIIIPYIQPFPVYIGASPEPDGPEADAPYVGPEMPLQNGLPPLQLEPVAPNVPAANSTPSTPLAHACQTGNSVQNYQPDPILVFIALKDSRVYAAVAYWIVGDVLHYVTSSGIHNQLSLQLVNRKLSAKLNSGHIIELVLPPE
jgi:hypothetical protein